MGSKMQRRDFLMTAPPAAWALAQTAKGAAPAQPSKPASSAKTVLETFNYQGVRLRPGFWQEQFQAARDTYFGFSNDDILQGFRAAAGLPAPGRPLGSEWRSRMTPRASWAQVNTGGIFGQWLSGMARMYRATADNAIRDKAVYLMTEWAKTLKSDGDCRMQHYSFEKLVCGLVDMHEYIGHPDAMALLEKVTDWASRTFNRARTPATPRQYMGSPSEWYTISENYWRAYILTGNPKFKAFAEVWLYPAYWDRFADTSAPASGVYGLHAYSHVNTFSSAAMTYAATGDPKYLRIIKNAFDWLQNTQCYATGGFGPHERLMEPNGNLGRSLEFRFDSFETVCGSWAAFKLARYLMSFTGEARYGDWVEKLIYNGVGAALPLGSTGKNYYYSDYRTGGGMKVYRWDKFTCCSGTLIQSLADYHNQIYFKDAKALYVNLYLPSEVTWSRPDGEVVLVQDTRYPEAETSIFSLQLRREMSFPLNFRIPGWSSDVSLRVNGAPVNVDCKPGTWATIERTWAPGDRVEIRIQLRLRYQAIDKLHPQRVAVMNGPVVLAFEAHYHEPAFRLPENEEDLSKWLIPDTPAGVFRVEPPGVTAQKDASWGTRVVSRFWPFYMVDEVTPYFMYFDLKQYPMIFY